MDFSRFRKMSWKEMKPLLWRHRILQVRLKRELARLPAWREKVAEEFFSVLSGKNSVRTGFLNLSTAKAYRKEKERLERFVLRFPDTCSSYEVVECYLSKRLEYPLYEVKKRISPFLYACRRYRENGENPELVETLSGLPLKEALEVSQKIEEIIDEILKVRADIFNGVALMVVKTVKDSLSVFTEDAFQACYEGFVRALEKFNPLKGQRFSTYLYFWLKQSVRRFVEKTSELVRPPAYEVGKVENLYLYFSHIPFENAKPYGELLASHVPTPLEELLEKEEKEERVKRGRRLLALLREKLSPREYDFLLLALERGDYERVRKIALPVLGKAVDIMQSGTVREVKIE